MSMTAVFRPALAATAVVLLLAAAVPALAQPMDGPPPDLWGDASVTRAEAEAKAAERFDTLDTNHDGVLSPDELVAARPAWGGGGHWQGPSVDRHGRDGRGMGAMTDGGGNVPKAAFIAAQLHRFDLADTDHDGVLTKPEREAAAAAMQARMEERMRDMPLPPPDDGAPGNGD